MNEYEITDPEFPVYDEWEVDMTKKEKRDANGDPQETCAKDPNWSLSYENNGMHMHFDPETPNGKYEGKIYSRCSVKRSFTTKPRDGVA